MTPGARSVGRSGQTGDLALDSGGVAFAAGHAGFELVRALLSALRAPQIDRVARGVAVAVFLEQFGLARFGFAQFGFEDGPHVGAARLLVGAAGAGRGRGGRCTSGGAAPPKTAAARG